MPQSLAAQLNNLPFSDVLLILLDSLRPALSAQGITLGADDARDLAAALADGRGHGKAALIEEAVVQVVEARLLLLRDSWRMDFPAALAIGPGGYRFLANYGGIPCVGECQSRSRNADRLGLGAAGGAWTS